MREVAASENCIFHQLNDVEFLIKYIFELFIFAFLSLSWLKRLVLSHELTCEEQDEDSSKAAEGHVRNAEMTLL